MKIRLLSLSRYVEAALQKAEYERDEYEDAPEIEWDTPISDDELAERLAWFWMPKEGE